METEVKLCFKDKESLYNYSLSDSFKTLVVSGCDPEPVLLENSYIDTKDLTVSMRGGMIRSRHYKGSDTDTYEFTVKYGGGVVNGLHQRLEWNVKSDIGEFSVEKFISAISDSNDPEDKLKEVFEGISDKDLNVLCTNSFTRTLYEISFENSRIEACFDSGIISNSDGSVTDEICELELELTNGDINELNKLALIIREQTGSVPLDASKYERTLKILKGEWKNEK